MPKKGGLGQFANSREDLARKRRVVFLRRGGRELMPDVHAAKEQYGTSTEPMLILSGGQLTCLTGIRNYVSLMWTNKLLFSVTLMNVMQNLSYVITKDFLRVFVLLDFLKYWKQRLPLNGQDSSWKGITSIISQGSISRPFVLDLYKRLVG